jgi:hypothetical protein
MSQTFSEAYIAHLRRGPFPHHPDPWAESGRYFHQLHGEMISALLGQLQPALLPMGYLVGREASLQIAAAQPDLFIQRHRAALTTPPPWDYSSAAAAILAEPGVILEGLEPDLDALSVKDQSDARLVTLLEIISPRNKTEISRITDYQKRRETLLRQAVNVVEIDLTRSVKRLVPSTLTEEYPYHLAVFLHDQAPRFVGIAFGEALKRCAIPLRAQVIGADLQAAYDQAYRQTALAAHLQTETAYHWEALPFPSLWAAAQQESLTAAVSLWQDELDRLLRSS